MKIYFSVLEYDDIPEIREVSLHPLNNCYIYNLQDSEVVDLHYLDWNNLTPYNGDLPINYNELYHSKDEKHFIKGETTSNLEDWTVYDDYRKIGTYKEGKLIEFKYKKYE